MAAVQTGYGGCKLVALKVFEQTADEARSGIGAQSPGSVGVADDERRVGNILHHHALPHKVIRDMNLLPVHLHLRLTGNLDLQTGGSDDDVGRELFARVQHDTVGNNPGDRVGSDICLAAPQTLEEVASRAETEPLIPGVVVRFEVRVKGDVLGELQGSQKPKHQLGDRGECLAEEEKETRRKHPRETLDPEIE